MKKIGILGSGIVAKHLASAFVKTGHQIMLGTSHPEKLAAWGKENPAFKSGSFADAASFGEILVLAVKGSAAESLLEKLPKTSIANKIIIDTTNPIADKAPVNSVLSYFTAQNKSLIELLQEKFESSKFVKAFNSIGAPLMFQPDFEEKPSMFICGDDAVAKSEVGEIVIQFGFEVEDLGTKEAGRPIEALCMLWCIEGFKTNRWDGHALRLIRKK